MNKPIDALTPATSLQDVLRDARKRPLNYALLKTKEGVVLKTDPKKSAEVMLRQAKSEGGMPGFGCMGTMTVEGKLVVMTSLVEDVPRNLPRLARKHFSYAGIKTKVQVRLPGGGTLDDEDEDAPAAEGYEAVGGGVMAPVGAPVDPAEMEERLQALADRLAAAAGAPPAQRDDLAARIAEARAMLTDSRKVEVPAFVDGIETDLAQLETELEAVRHRLDCEFLALSPDLDGVLSRGAPNVAKKAASIAAVFKAELHGDLRKAQSALVLLTSFLNAELPKLPPAVPGEGDACTVPETPQACISGVVEPFGGFWSQICEPPPREDAARTAEHDAIMAQQAKIVALYKAGVPAGPQRDALFAEMKNLANMIGTAHRIARVEETQPETAARMREAMTGFDAELGAGTEVTDELLAKFDTDSGNAEADFRAAQAALNAARALPTGPARDAAIAAAEATAKAKYDAWEAARRKSVAAQGKRGLMTAMTSGPLAPDAARPLDDADAARFVEAFPRDPLLAEDGLEIASTAPHPGAVAEGMSMLCDKLADGFEAEDGATPAPGFDGDAYARDLMRGAAAEGGDFMAQAAGYIGRGGHIVPAPIPTPSGVEPVELERDRSNFLAAAVIGAGGQIDPESPQAQEALDHLRFNPDVVAHPTPSLNARVIKTFSLLSDPEAQAEAQGILDGVGQPEGTGQALLGRALGKAPGDLVTEGEAREQVMAALMTPVHQGKVGSCFATAGVRRMSELDPLESMRRYAELAETGTFTPRNGEPPIPAVMSFDAKENPLIRSMEYSAATVTGAIEDDWVQSALAASTDSAMDGLAEAIGDQPELLSRLGLDNWKVDEGLIRDTLKASFRVEYDATRSSPTAADGSSDHGIFVLIQTVPSERVITTEEDYAAALTDRVLAAIGEPADSDKGKEIARIIASGDFLASLVKNGTSPWDLGGGGFDTWANDVVFGGNHDGVEVTDGRTLWDTLGLRLQGAQSTEILTKLLENTQGSDAIMIAGSNEGTHAFNFLPNDPSLAALREGGDIAGNIERTLVKPGLEIAMTGLGADKAAEIARELMLEFAGLEGDPARLSMLESALRGPFAGMTPGQMKLAVLARVTPWVQARAQQKATDWRADELAAGNARTDEEFEKERETYVQWLNAWASDMFHAVSAKEIRLPRVTFADTNWGNAGKDWVFAMAPCPTTGQLMLWKLDRHTGEMLPKDADWVDVGWSTTVDMGEE